MLNPETAILPAIIAALRSNATLLTAMDGDPTRIYGHIYAYGLESRLTLAINEMKPPSVLVAWAGSGPAARQNGQELWAHSFDVYVRIANQAGVGSPSGYGNIWYAILNGAITSPVGRNIRWVELLPTLTLMDTPNIVHVADEQLMDFFVGHFVICEIGDN